MLSHYFCHKLLCFEFICLFLLYSIYIAESPFKIVRFHKISAYISSYVFPFPVLSSLIKDTQKTVHKSESSLNHFIISISIDNTTENIYNKLNIYTRFFIYIDIYKIYYCLAFACQKFNYTNILIYIQII